MLKLLTKDTVRKISFVVGKRGSGKTYTINYFLNHYTKPFILNTNCVKSDTCVVKNQYCDTNYESVNTLEEHNTVWFRTDIAKLYYLNKNDNNSRISLYDYLYAQIMYVVFRYSSGNKYEGKDLKDTTIDKHFEEMMNNDSFYKNLSNNLGKTIDKTKDELKEQADSCISATNNNQNKSKPIDYKHKKIVAMTILEYLKTKNINVILFIDGIDNIDYAVDSLQNSMMKNIIETISSLERNYTKISQYFKHIIVSCREETLFEFEKKDMLVKNFNGSYIRKNVITLNPNTILKDRKSKNKAMHSDECEYNALRKELEGRIEDSIKEADSQELPKVILDDFFNFAENYSKTIKEVFNMNLTENSSVFIKTDDDILTFVFDSSLREYFYSLIQSFICVRVYCKCYNILDNGKIPSDFFQHNQVRKNLLVESLALNGNLYLSEIVSTRIVNYQKNVLNIFRPIDINVVSIKNNVEDFKIIYDESRNIRYNFLTLFILKFLEKENTPKEEEHITEELKKLHYKSRKLIVSILLKLLEYGYIEYYKNNDNINTSSYVITKKGELMMHMSINNASFIYSCSIDSYFPSRIINGELVSIHKSNDDTHWANYSYSLVNTTITFIRILKRVFAEIKEKYSGDQEDFNFRYSEIVFDNDNVIEQLSLIINQDLSESKLFEKIKNSIFNDELIKTNF